MDKVVLNNLEAEQAVLGAIIESKSARDEFGAIGYKQIRHPL